jgi:Concanavalin A-like lectin/glucanases superfamily
MPLISRTPYFSPLNVSGCVLWFDAGDINTMTFSGNTVTSWRSKGSSTVSTNVVSGGFTNPTYTSYNNLPALGFNGTSTSIQTGNVSVPGTGVTWITCSVNLTPVTASTPVDSSVVLATAAPGERAIRYILTGGSTYYSINSNLTNTATILRSDTNQNANGIRGFMDTAAYFTGFTNGTQTVSNTTAVNYIATTNQPFLMGQWASGYLNGYIYESLVYNRVLSLSEYQQVEGYLAQKWGFTASLPAGHPGLGPIVYRWKQEIIRLPYYNFFSPNSISGLTLWFDAADSNTMTIAGGLVTGWLSKGSSAVSTSVVTGGSYTAPSYTTYNGRPALGFNGTTTYVQTGNVTLTASGTSWIASAVNLTPITGTTPIDASLVIATRVPEKSIRFNCNVNATCYSINSNVGNTTTVLRQDTNNNVNGIRGFIDTAGYFTAFGNGTQTISNITTVNYLRPTGVPFFMGAWLPGFLNGFIQEILVYDAILTLAQYQQIEGYLAQKWGFVGSLAAGHPSLTLPVGAPATGVGKQDLSFLPSAPASVIVTTNLITSLDAVSYTSGSTWTALVGNNYTVNGTFTTDSYAIVFNGSAYAQDLTGITSSTMYSYTLDVWFYAASGASGSVIGELGQPTLGSWSLTLISINSNTISVGFYSGAQYKLSVGSYSANTWTHVSYTYNDTTKVIIGYVNGIYVSSATVTKLWPTAVYLTTGGSAVPDATFTGRIGAFKVYNSILTADQIKQNYNALAGRYGLSTI